MGFNIRYIDIDIINDYINDGLDLNDLFKSDSLIFSDEISSKVFDWNSKKMSNFDIKTKIENYENK
jgi:hypothetical protein